ncbi:sigma-54 dependent transcriptional regulator [Salinisphaera aquimarina]|uniref:Sigma 54-interacting transcriptional regulator n=1 Tax=Salinisphaera aquimarina TaxID=2094031 RepID=A0ABV7ER42_9GAMM
MEQREIVCLDCGGPVQRAAFLLEDRGWRLHHAKSPAEAERLVRARQASVALASFGHRFTQCCSVDALEDLFAKTAPSAWVALVERELLDDPRLPYLIANYFRDYLTTPLSAEHLGHSVGHAFGMAAMDIAASPRSADADMENLPHAMLARSPVMRDVVRNLKKCARSGAPVTITGESGTGKELAALAIHRQSSQSDGPFIAVNCGALPANLIQSELFGSTRGAFTGADRDKIGRIEAARGGTLFLDEIGDLSLGLQVNLLRFLQEGVIEKVGAHQPIAVDTRVIAATHRDLEDAVEQGEFRQDLYYRLNVLRAQLPALRDRGDDVLALANAYLVHFARMNRSRVTGFSQQAINLINSYHWPGNIRELVNRVQRAVVMSDRRLLTPIDLGLDRRSALRAPRTLEQARGEAEKDALSRCLYHSGHNIAETARNLGVSRLTVYRLIEKHGINEGARQIQ